MVVQYDEIERPQILLELFLVVNALWGGLLLAGEQVELESCKVVLIVLAVNLDFVIVDEAKQVVSLLDPFDTL